MISFYWEMILSLNFLSWQFLSDSLCPLCKGQKLEATAIREINQDLGQASFNVSMEVLGWKIMYV
jgi:hypothetical protein